MGKYRVTVTEEIQAKVQSLSHKQLLKQVCCPTLGRIGEECLEEFGAMFFHPMERSRLEGVIAEFKKTCTIPPFIVSDLECGPGNMILGATKFPYMMGLSQTNSETLAYETGRIAAQEAEVLGFNWTFSPVADLAVDPDSPVVSMRSPGVTPEHVVKIAGAYMKGLQEHGMMATIKHFPGDGFTSLDHHLTTPVISLSQEKWWHGPGRVFQELIDRGAMAVMPGHIALPCLDEPDERGLYPPATISPNLLQGVLRKRMGFEGLIVSDALEMGGAVGFRNYYDVCADALESGCDMLLFPRINERFYSEMEQRLACGKLSIETLRDRASRIVAVKTQMGLFNQEAVVAGSTQFDREAHQRTAKQVAQACITVVRDRAELIPFPIEPQTRVLHVVIMNNHDQLMELHARMKQEISKFSDHVTQWLDPGPDALFEAASEKAADLIICSIGCKLSYGINVVRLHDEVARNMMGGWTKLRTPIIFVSHFHPFVHREYEASIDSIINMYGDIECSAELLLQAMTGKIPINRELFAHQ
ncbi:glycoside hydrolase family 3 protein [Paenibacillus sp. 2RAB27]|uniref:glycoside hydrolase family 3 protein n=1 Tax=Paenibacillus sp. 2RAB27 TaxID=3232991 RepID=UPI003F982962